MPVSYFPCWLSLISCSLCQIGAEIVTNPNETNIAFWLNYDLLQWAKLFRQWHLLLFLGPFVPSQKRFSLVLFEQNDVVQVSHMQPSTQRRRKGRRLPLFVTIAKVHSDERTFRSFRKWNPPPSFLPSWLPSSCCGPCGFGGTGKVPQMLSVSLSALSIPLGLHFWTQYYYSIAEWMHS